jgi:hypothetical protein
MQNRFDELKTLLEADSFKCEIIDYSKDQKHLKCSYKSAWFSIIDREENDKFAVSPSLIRSTIDPSWYFTIKTPSINISKSKSPDTIHKELHTRFIADFLHEAERAMKELKQVDQELNEAADKKRAIGEYLGEEFDLSRSKAVFFMGENEDGTSKHRLTVGVGIGIELSISGLTLEQFKKLVEVIK